MIIAILILFALGFALGSYWNETVNDLNNDKKSITL